MNFAAFQQLNLIRQIEQNDTQPWVEEIASCAPTVERDLCEMNMAFNAKAVSRAEQLSRLTGLGTQYARFEHRNKALIAAVLAIMALFGFFAVLQTFAAAEQRINVFWLLLLLVGLNALSMVLWVVAMLRRGKRKSPLFYAYRKLTNRFMRKSDQAAFLGAWSRSHLQGRTGRWFLSKQTHGAWVLYLAGGLLALLLILSGQQVDFVWGTTILSSDLFVRLTQWLGSAPAMLGFDVPNAQTVLSSKQGATIATLETVRSTWASFVIGCVLVYALIPRLLLWVASGTALAFAKRAYQPEWDAPYFYELRARLLPQNRSLGVVDKDQQPDQAIGQLHSTLSQPTNLHDLNLPTQAYSGAFEWSEHELIALPINAAVDFGLINDVHEQTGALQAIRQSPKPVVIMVPLHRAADRGAARFLSDINALADLTLLVVQVQQTNTDKMRWAGWQTMAERIALAEDRLHLVVAP